MHRIARWLIVAGLFGAVVMPVAALAQGTASPAGVEIALWPEYDQRAMLVIYRVTLPAATALPTTVELPIPTRVGDPMAVAQRASDGTLILAPYELRAGDGEWANLAIQADSLTLQVEFYDSLAFDGAARTYDFVWPANRPVSDLAYEVMQPVGASGMSIDPPPAAERVGPDGLTYHAGTLSPQAGTSEARLQLSYTKADAGLTVETVPPAAGSGLPVVGESLPTGGGDSLTRLMPWLIGGLGLVLLAIAAVVVVRSRAEAAGERRRHRPGRRAASAAQPLDASAVFCHQCGNKGDVTDTFCRKCGTRLRA